MFRYEDSSIDMPATHVLPDGTLLALSADYQSREIYYGTGPIVLGAWVYAARGIRPQVIVTTQTVTVTPEMLNEGRDQRARFEAFLGTRAD